MTIRKNLLFSVVVGLGFFPLLTITKPAEAHDHCAVLPYTAPSAEIGLGALIKAAFAIDIRINKAAANVTSCPGSVVGEYEISDLTSINLALSIAAEGTWDVKIGNNLFKQQQFFNGGYVAFSIPPHQQGDAIEFNLVDNNPDIVKVNFTPVSVINGTAIVKYKDPGGSNYYYKTPEPLTILGTGVVLGAIPVLKKEYAKRKKKKDEEV